MRDLSWTPSLWQSFAEACSEEARALLRWERPPLETIAFMQEGWHFYDALLLTARLLPPREAVWWGCLCCWDMVGRGDAAAQNALRACVQWVLTPDEVARREAEQSAGAAGLRTPAGALANAIFYTGSVAAADLPAVTVPAEVVYACVCSAVLLAAVAREPMFYNRHYRRFTAMGLEIVQGRHLCPQATAELAPAEAAALQVVTQEVITLPATR